MYRTPYSCYIVVISIQLPINVIRQHDIIYHAVVLTFQTLISYLYYSTQSLLIRMLLSLHVKRHSNRSACLVHCTIPLVLNQQASFVPEKLDGGGGQVLNGMVEILRGPVPVMRAEKVKFS